MSQPWPDGLMDAIALTEVIRRDDEHIAQDACFCAACGMQAILRHGNPMDIAVTLAKLLAEAADDLDVSPGHLRLWPSRARGGHDPGQQRRGAAQRAARRPVSWPWPPTRTCRTTRPPPSR